MSGSGWASRCTCWGYSPHNALQGQQSRCLKRGWHGSRPKGHVKRVRLAPLNPSMKRLSDRLSLCVIQGTRGNQYTPDWFVPHLVPRIAACAASKPYSGPSSSLLQFGGRRTSSMARAWNHRSQCRRVVAATCDPIVNISQHG